MEVIESGNAERPAVRCIAWLDGWRDTRMWRTRESTLLGALWTERTHKIVPTVGQCMRDKPTGVERGARKLDAPRLGSCFLQYVRRKLCVARIAPEALRKEDVRMPWVIQIERLYHLTRTR